MPKMHSHPAFIRRSMATALALGLAATAVHAQNAAAPSAALIKSAQAEGRLMVYSSEDEAQQRFSLAAFEKKYGIKGAFVRFPTGPLMQRFSTETDAKNGQADVVSVSSPTPFETMPDRFAPFNPKEISTLAAWPQAVVKPNYLYYTADVVALVYNTDLLKPDQVPKKWADLADPKWKGKFLLTDPQVADNYVGWLDAVERSQGIGLLKRIATQQYKVTQSGASGVQMVAAGAYAFNAPTFTAFSRSLIDKKAPIAIQYLSEPSVISPRAFAIAAAAPHPNAARLYMDWLLSDEGIRTYCSFGRTSVFGDPAGARGCLPTRDGELMHFGVSNERRRTLAQALGVAN